MLPRSPEALRVISKALADDVLWHQGIGERVYRAGKLIGKLGGIASIGVTTGGVAYGGPAALAAPGLMAQAGVLVMGSAAVPAVQGAGLAMQAKDIGAYGRAPLRAYRKMKRDFYGLRRNEQRAFIDKGLAPSGYMFIKFNGKLKLTVFVRGV
jgi:hypothetical protein